MKDQSQKHKAIQFNGTIKIEINIQQIAEMMYDAMDQSNPHSRMIADYTIANAIESPRGISALYNALNGHQYKPNYAVNDIVCVTHISTYGWSEKLRSCIKGEDTTIVANIIEIKPFKREQIKIEYNYVNDKGIKKTAKEWIETSSILRTASMDDMQSWEDAMDYGMLDKIKENEDSSANH